MFREGSFTLLLPEDEKRFVYRRDTQEEHMLVVCNFSTDPAPLGDIPVPENAQLLSNYPNQTDHLQPFEARLYLWNE